MKTKLSLLVAVLLFAFTTIQAENEITIGVIQYDLSDIDKSFKDLHDQGFGSCEINYRSKMLEQPREMGEMTLKDFVPMSLRCQMRSNRKSGKCKEKQNIAGERFANHYPRRCKI